MKTIIFSLLFVASLFSQDRKHLANEFKPVYDYYWSYTNGSFMERIQGWSVHSSLSRMNVTEKEREIYGEVVASITMAEQLAQAAALVNAYIGGESKVIRAADAKSACYIAIERWKDQKKRLSSLMPFALKSGIDGAATGVHPVNAELLDIYFNVYGIEHEGKMIEFYNRNLKDLK